MPTINPYPYFPDATNSYFTLPNDISRLVVEGSTQTARPAQVATRPFFHHSKSQTVNVKVGASLHETTCEWKVCEPQQTFVDVTESTSNVNYVRNAVQKRWGEEYTLVTADGLEIEDSSGTQGR